MRPTVQIKLIIINNKYATYRDQYTSIHNYRANRNSWHWLQYIYQPTKENWLSKWPEWLTDNANISHLNTPHSKNLDSNLVYIYKRWGFMKSSFWFQLKKVEIRHIYWLYWTLYQERYQYILNKPIKHTQMNKQQEYKKSVPLKIKKRTKTIDHKHPKLFDRILAFKKSTPFTLTISMTNIWSVFTTTENPYQIWLDVAKTFWSSSLHHCLHL